MLPDTLSEQFVLYLDVLDGGSFSAAARKHPLTPVSYTHLRAHETGRNLVCRLLLEKKKKEVQLIN